MTFPGLTRVGNRAYRLLADALSLPGTQGLADVDISQAFAVHPLDAIVQGAQVSKYLFGKTVTLAGGTTRTLIDPFSDAGTGWDQVTRDGSTIAGDGVPTSHDCLIGHVGMEPATSGDFNAGIYLIRYTWDGTNLTELPLTNLLEDVTLGYATVDNHPYYARRMPMFVRADDDEKIYARVSLTAGSDVHFMMVAYGAPAGVLLRPGYGT